jgi:hypothetical protein
MSILYEARGGDLHLHIGGLIPWPYDPGPVRSVRAELGGQHAQWERHMTITFLCRRKRKPEVHILTPNGAKWYTVTRNGQVEWDSRSVFSCYESLEEYRAHPERHGYGPDPGNDAAIARIDAGLAALNESLARKEFSNG